MSTERKIMTAQEAQDAGLVQAVDLLEDVMGNAITPETIIDVKIVDGVAVAYSIGDDGDGTDMPLV